MSLANHLKRGIRSICAKNIVMVIFGLVILECCAKLYDIQTLNKLDSGDLIKKRDENKIVWHKFKNTFYQELQTSTGIFLLYKAYLDVRQEPTVRIIGYLNQHPPRIETYCKLTYKTPDEDVVRKVNYIQLDNWYFSKMKNKTHQAIIYQPYLISCDLPPMNETRLPTAVSLVEDRAIKEVTNRLNIIYNKQTGPKDMFGVCCRALKFREDISFRIVEWLELLKILGATKVFLYKTELHPNTHKGNVSINQPSLTFQNAYFLQQYKESNKEGPFKEIPTYNYMLQQVYRAKDHLGPNINCKSFQNTLQTLIFYNHKSERCLKNSECNRYSVDLSIGQLNHYRSSCSKEYEKFCSNSIPTVKDITIWTWKKELMENMNKSLLDLGLII
ncbi:uncharacterized protein LOC111709337 isoform X2 [Eurytemora carolleeae]|uniref:uncharacterized protein LOC111709337 isoform X2 n=1 Tax=Eurytemora carolleeae TaxID=1294199 RepID=UPI000C7827DB|nr:uncharacterized protein LOC111709337 isoform X2 [Eurytemora carolleeae]|eukprot:XP_023338747.1 uncharacterized protein LOC111709337 isoform X2 [Eurytemora affinis]